MSPGKVDNAVVLILQLRKAESWEVRPLLRVSAVSVSWPSARTICLSGHLLKGNRGNFSPDGLLVYLFLHWTSFTLFLPKFSKWVYRLKIVIVIRMMLDLGQTSKQYDTLYSLPHPHFSVLMFCTENIWFPYMYHFFPSEHCQIGPIFKDSAATLLRDQ